MDAHKPPPEPAKPAAEEPAQQQQQQIELQVVDLVLDGVNIGVGANPEGDKALVVGPFLLRLIVPLNADVGRLIGRELAGGVQIATPADIEAVTKRAGVIRR